MAHPYQQYESTEVWRAVDAAINALAKNGDVNEATAHDYIVGYICQQLDRAKVLKDAAARNA